MPLLDHFHLPLHGPRRWEGFHHAWATVIVQQLNQILPADYYAEPEISVGPELEIDVATLELTGSGPGKAGGATVVWACPRPQISAKVDFARLDSYEVRVYQNVGGAERLRAGTAGEATRRLFGLPAQAPKTNRTASVARNENAAQERAECPQGFEDPAWTDSRKEPAK